MQRQWSVLEKQHPPRLHVIIEEAVLQRVISNLQIQYEQLLHLQRMAALPNITIQILPLRQGIVWGIFGQAPFDIFGFALPKKPVLYVDGLLDHSKIDSAFEVTHYKTTFRAISERCLNAQDSLAFIHETAKRLQRHQARDL
jgi:hypothetical protein